MNPRQLMAGAGLLLLTSALLPAQAYHIDGAAVPGGNVAGATPTMLTSADWETLPAALFTTCESNGPRDDRLGGAGRNGFGGLCTTGENDASGLAAPEDADGNGLPDDVGLEDYVHLDVCDTTTVNRNTAGPFPGNLVGNSGPYLDGGNECNGLDSVSLSGDNIQAYFKNPGRTDEHAFTGEVGAFSCAIPTTGAVAGPPVTADFALYYSRLYAWWSYDGDGWYTPGAGAGNANAELATGPEDGESTNNDNGPANPLGFSDSVENYHGHATVFVNLGASKGGASLVGSVETFLVDDVTLSALGLSDDPALAAGGGGALGNNCGASPSSPPSGGTGAAATCKIGTLGCATTALGPVLRAPSNCLGAAAPNFTEREEGCRKDGPIPDPTGTSRVAAVVLVDSGTGVSRANTPGLTCNPVVTVATGSSVTCSLQTLLNTFGVCPFQAVSIASTGTGPSTITGRAQCDTEFAATAAVAVPGADAAFNPDPDDGPLVCSASYPAGERALVVRWTLVCVV
jgi:hypothetical protein